MHNSYINGSTAAKLNDVDFIGDVKSPVAELEGFTILNLANMLLVQRIRTFDRKLPVEEEELLLRIVRFRDYDDNRIWQHSEPEDYRAAVEETVVAARTFLKRCAPDTVGGLQ